MNVNDNYSCEHHSLQLCPFHCHTPCNTTMNFFYMIYIYIYTHRQITAHCSPLTRWHSPLELIYMGATI